MAGVLWVAWGATSATRRWWAGPPAPVAGDAPASVIVAGPEAGAMGTTLSLRKKLDARFTLHFSQARLEEILGWIGDQVDLPFVYQADLSSLEPITVRNNDRPLYAMLADVLARRNLAFVLQRESVVIIACRQNAVTLAHDGTRAVSYEIEAEILGMMNEPVELYCGDRGQLRLRLIGGPSASSAHAAQGIFDLQYSLLEDDALSASGSVSVLNDEWADAPLKLDGLHLRLRPSTEDGIDLALGVQFRYMVETAEGR